jgi:carbohydrate esterase-like protein/GDSL-like lipase/acylhydrolase family protein
MKYKLIHSAFVLFLLFYDCSFPKKTATNNVLPASSLSPFGRYDRHTSGDLELISSAINFGFTFLGKECKVHAYLTDTTAHNYLQYELDGIYQKRIKIIGNDRSPMTITASKEGMHTVWIYKATEAHTGPIFIEKITGQNLKPLKRAEAPLIEFIGNSITCGAAADPSETACGTGVYHDQHNAYYAYGPRVARALSVNFILSSVSGIGIYRTWNMNGPSMPQVYEKTDFQADSKRLWNFETYEPAIVSIALGTNDLSNGDGKHERSPFDSSVFVSNYIKFVQLVKSKYAKATIALLSSPMVNGESRILLQNCLGAVKENIDALYPSDKKVALYFFKPMQARGCAGHPNVEDHAILAGELTPFFKGLLF